MRNKEFKNMDKEKWIEKKKTRSKKSG